MAFFSGILVFVVIVAWVWVARAGSRLEAVLMAAIAWSAVMVNWLQSPLSVLFGPVWSGSFALLVAVGTLRLARRSAPLPAMPAGGIRHRGIVVPGLVLVVMALQLGLVVAARATPDGAVALSWPLAGATFKVMHGGNSVLVNNHYGISAQRYALDIIAIDRLRFRAQGLGPAEFDRYVIFDTPVQAPCSGEVVAARDGMADGAAPAEASQLAGNFAAIYCHDVTVLLAHFRMGTLAVKAGDTVREGQVIGRVGSSGNSSEPHLHIHADRGRVSDPTEMTTTAVGAPMTFSGRFLVRNDVVTP